MVDQQYVCRVCGLDLQSIPEYLATVDNEPFYQDGYPTFNICPCCNSESGYEDTSVVNAQRARQYWIEGGQLWSQPQFRPPDWGQAAQSRQIPAE